MKNGDAQVKLETVIERKIKLEGLIGLEKTALHGLHDPTHKAPELAEWRLRKENLLRKYDGDRDEAMKREGGYLLMFEEKIEALSAELQTFAEKKRKAQERLAELTNELKGLDLTLSVDELLFLQKKVADCQKNLDSLQQIISAQKAVIDDDQGHGKTLEALTAKRENILADIASGCPVEEGAIDKVTEEITTVKALHEKHAEDMKTASQTIAGLNRKVAQAEDALSLAMANFRAASIAFLKMEIDQAGEEFVGLGDKLSVAFQRVVSLASLCEELGEPVNVFGPYTSLFKIPSFSLDVCKSKACRENPGLLFDYPGVNRQDALNTEVGRLAGLGLKLSV